MQKAFDLIKEKIKVTSLEIIVTGTKDKPYFEIKYKEAGKEDYNIGYGSYDLNNVFGWKEECFEIVNQVAEEYKDGWIPCSEKLPDEPEAGMLDMENLPEYNVVIKGGDKATSLHYAGNGEWYDFITEGFYEVTVWRPLPEYQPKEV